MTTPTVSTLLYSAPCPTCGQIVTWAHHPHNPHPTPLCKRPTCRVEQLVEK